GDDVVDPGTPPVQGHAQAVHDPRTVDHTQRTADRGLGGQFLVGAAEERSPGLAAVCGRATLAQLLVTIVVGDVCRATGRHVGVVGRQTVDGIARVGVPVESLAHA